jgi:transcriptional regulator
MYIPKINEETDQARIFDFIKNNGFGLLISAENDVPFATHLPLILDFNEKNTPLLRGHVARANPHWQMWERVGDVLVIFNGAHSYISPSWYEHPSAATWNYLAVHMYGKIQLVSDDKLLDSLKILTNKYEKTQENPLFFENLEDDYVKKILRGIVGFEIEIEKIEAKAKLSQNKNEKDYNNIIEQLNKTENALAGEIAKEMMSRRF